MYDSAFFEVQTPARSLPSTAEKIIVMRLYILYLITSLLIAWTIILMLGVSAGFASKIPVVALCGSLLLCAVATPVLLYNNRAGLIIGLIAILLMVPYSIGFAKTGLEDGVFNWGVLLFMLPALLVLLCVYMTARYLLFKTGFNLGVPASSGLKLFLAFIPISLTILYFIFYGKEWF